MPIGIEIVTDVIRCYERDENRDITKCVEYGVTGIPPRINEPFVWNNPNTFRRSIPGPFVSLTEAWVQANDKSKDMHKNINYSLAKCTWKKPDDLKEERSATDLIAEAISQTFSRSPKIKAVLAVDNSLHEFLQDSLLRSLRYAQFVDIELLWRPICIALYFLNFKGRDNFSPDDRLIIIDLDSYKPELTVLQLKEYDNNIVPVRNLPSKQKQFETNYSCYLLKREFIQSITNNNDNLIEQLSGGPGAKAFSSFLETRIPRYAWILDELIFKKYTFSDNWHEEIRDFKVDGVNFKDFRETVLKFDDWSSKDYIIWNGFPARIQQRDLFNENESILDEYAVSFGAADYAYRLINQMPTYLDTIPELEIMSAIKETRKHDFFSLIKGGEITGGSTVRTKEPREEFSLESGTKQFTAVLRIDKDVCRKLVTDLDIEPNLENVPLLIKAEQKPANGHAIVTIEGAEGHQDVFGSRRQIQLNWNNMEDFEFLIYSGPDVYPIQGRIATDPDCLEVARTVATNNMNLGSIVTYQGHNVSYASVHEPWGYRWPFGEFLGEPSRALFGAKIEDDTEIKRLAEKIGLMIQTTVAGTNNRHKYLNYMFRYAPAYFLDELRDIYGHFRQVQMNTVYAVGRVFYLASDYELFLKYLLRVSSYHGYPYYNNDYYTKAFFWSFFRPLCYYEDTINADRNLIERVLECIYNYSETMSKKNWPMGKSANEIKYLLCGILFSLRFRKKHKDFLKHDSGLYDKMSSVITGFIPPIDYPRYMFAVPKPDKLNDYVSRFLNEEQTKEDIDALQGLVTSLN